jgi:hypothetical protein
MVAAMTAALAACGGGRLGLGGSAEEEPEAAVDRTRANTPQNRAIQVAATAARASYCAFGMDREQLRADYLAYEREQGATPEAMEKLEQLYDATYRLFSKKVREISDSCSKENIEEIRPQINRHLDGDYTPEPRKPDQPQETKIDIRNLDTSEEEDVEAPSPHDTPTSQFPGDNR